MVHQNSAWKSYDHQVVLLWISFDIIEIKRHFLILFSFTLFDVEESTHQCDLKHDLKQCCGDTWLSITSIPSAQVTSLNLDVQGTQGTIGLGPVQYCGKNLSMPPMVFKESE